MPNYKYWMDGAGDGDWGNTNNWSATDGGAGGAGIPGAGATVDDVVILKRGTHSIATGLNQSAVTVASIQVAPGFGGDASGISIGDSAGNPLQINVSSTSIGIEVDNRRARFFRFSGTVGLVHCKDMAGDFFLSGGSATSVRAGETGYFEAADDVEITNFDSAGAGFLIKGDATSPVDMVMEVSHGAQGECWRKIHTLILDGKLTTANAAVGSAGSGTSIWRVRSTGELVIKQTGDIANLYVAKNGTVTAVGGSGPTSAAAAPPAIAVLRAHTRARLSLPSNIITVTAKQPVGPDIYGGYQV